MISKTFRKPDFIGIGPPKTGTTWIYANLLKHPSVKMPPHKEIRYFWERIFIGRQNLLQQLRSDHWHYKGRRFFYKKRFQAHYDNLARLRVNIKSLLWDLKYLSARQTDSWYSGLFDSEAVSGDITAKYCELPAEEIKRIKQIFPHLKVIITLRNPVEREWSRAKMNLCRKLGREISEVSDQEFIDQFNDPPQKLANDYAALIERWRQEFGRDQVLHLYYDELSEDPVSYYTRVCNFLNIAAPSPTEENDLRKIVFGGLKGDIPSELKKVLFDMHCKNIGKLIEYDRGVTYPEVWMREYSKLT